MKQTIKQMQARINFLKDVAATGWLSMIVLGQDSETKDSFSREHTYPISCLLTSATKSKVKHTEVAALLEQAEGLALEAVRASYEIHKANGVDFHFTELDKLVEAVREHKGAVYAHVQAVIAAITPTMESICVVLDQTCVEAIDVNELNTHFEIVAPFSQGAAVVTALRHAGFKTAVSDTYPATCYIYKPEQAPEPAPVKIKDAALLTVKDIPRYIKEILFTKIRAGNGPYYWTLQGTPSGGTDTCESAEAAFEKLRKWCESIGAEVNMVRNGYATLQRSRKYRLVGASVARLLIEITDPAARFIEQFLEQVRGRHWRVTPPRSRYEWLRYKEAGGPKR